MKSSFLGVFFTIHVFNKFKKKKQKLNNELNTLLNATEHLFSGPFLTILTRNDG